MTRQVALAEETYVRLKRAKRPGESFSQVIERILDHQKKDPMAFLEAVKRHKLTMPADALLAQIEADRDASREPL